MQHLAPRAQAQAPVHCRLSLSDVSAAGIILDSFQVQRLALARAQAHHTKDLLMFISLYYITGDCARTL